jgi:molybdopterin molybdotransferase
MTRAAVTTIAQAMAGLRGAVRAVEAEIAPIDDTAGRALAQDIALDHPSPPCDVSAMDGYAVRTPVAGGATLRVLGEAAAGRPAPAMPADADGVIRIFTGAPVPEGASAVAQRELFKESADAVTLRPDAVVREGMHIRRRGENGAPGDTVCAGGRIIGAAQMAALASCGITQVRVRRRVRIGVLVTGDEALPADSQPEAWQLRDSNGPSLRGMIAPLSWIERVECVRVGDERAEVAAAVASLLDRSDALLVTGGVSAGDRDHVPGALGDLGVGTLFHRLAIRPGKPVLGAVDGMGRPILGLPGNPVSALVTASLLALPALCLRAGVEPPASAGLVDVRGDARAPASLHWFPLVRVDPNGGASLVESRGSGDWIAAARSDGFIEIPPGESVRGLRRFRPWRW